MRLTTIGCWIGVGVGVSRIDGCNGKGSEASIPTSPAALLPSKRILCTLKGTLAPEALSNAATISKTVVPLPVPVIVKQCAFLYQTVESRKQLIDTKPPPD